MRIPKYQWLMQEPNQSCGFCDEVAVTSEFDKNFQLIADVIDNPEIYPDGDYEYNPFNPITTEDLVFDIESLPNDGEYFTLYLNSSYSSSLHDNVFHLQIMGIYNGKIAEHLALFNARVRSFLIANIDPLLGTTTSLYG
jgi:hypothetical protein